MFNREKKYCFDMKEEDVTEFICAAQRGCEKIHNFTMGNCLSPKSKEGMWFVSFKANKKQYRNIMIELCKIGTIQIDVNGTYFVKK